jgi:hypothetical protein
MNQFFVGGGNPYMQQLMAQLGMPGYMIQQQAAALPPFALPGIHEAYMNALGPMAFNPAMGGIPPFLAMPSPGQMQPITAPVSGGGYSGAPQRMQFDAAPGESNSWWARHFNPQRRQAAKFEKMLKSNDFLRAEFEQSIGGRIVDWGSKNDGRFTVERFPNQQPGQMPGIGMNPSALTVNQMLQQQQSGISGLTPLMGILGGLGGLAGGAMFGHPFMGLILGGLGGLASGAMTNAMMGPGMMGMGTLGPGGGMAPAMLGLGGAALPFAGGSPILGQLPFPVAGPFGFGTMDGAGFGSWNPLAMPGRINNSNPLYEQAHQAQVASVLNDPSLSVEDKVMLMLMLIMKKMDQDIERQMQYINALQQQQSNRQAKGKALGGIGTLAGGLLGGPLGAGIGGSLGGKLGGGGNSSPSVDVETQKLQRMIQKRSQMFEMMSAIMRKYDDTAKNVIQNIR